MSIKKVSRLIRFERRISMGLAAEYFSSLIDEEVSEGDFYKIAYGRIPTYMKPRNGKGIAAFAGFFEEELKAFLTESGWDPEDDFDESIRIELPRGAETGLNFLEDEIPYPLLWGPLDFATISSETSEGGTVYWLLWDTAKKEITGIEPFDSDLFEIQVEPKSVYQLALQTLDDEFWPEPDSRLVTSMKVVPASHLASPALDEPSTEVFSSAVTALQADDGFDNLFGPLVDPNVDKAKPQRKQGYNWPLITGALLELLTIEGKSNKSGVIAELVDKRVWGLGKRTLESALARAEEAYANKKND